MLGLAHRLGWAPPQFWGSTPYEFETALAEAKAMAEPPRPKPMKPQALAAYLRSIPGSKKG